MNVTGRLLKETTLIALISLEVVFILLFIIYYLLFNSGNLQDT
jgi:Co/Zn/Cd efflux system component